jgi:hypothetical protein
MKAGRRPKLSVGELTELRAKLAQRHTLLHALRGVSIKALAHEAGLSRQTLNRLDCAIYGDHEPDPP